MIQILAEDFGRSSAGPFLVGVVTNDANGNGFYDPGEGMSGVNDSCGGSAGAAAPGAPWLLLPAVFLVRRKP